jgi:hypothetical protein
MRLNRWQRLGIVASVVWAIGIGLLGHSTQALVAVWKIHCLLLGGASCHSADTVYLVVHWQAIAAFALVPILVAWLTVRGLVALIRRVRAGPS